MSSRRFLSWLGGVALVAAAACGGDEEKKPAAEPEIQAFSSSVREIQRGDVATLSWVTANATSVSLVDGAGMPVDLGLEEPAAGGVYVSPEETTTYTLTARNDAGKAVSRTLTLGVVIPADAPAIASFTATPAEVPVGGTVRLAWATANATTVQIADATGRPVDLRGAEVGEGEVSIEARASTTWRLVARGPGGVAEATASVVVQGAPTVRLDGPVAAVVPGAEVVLSWTSTNASRVVIRAGDDQEIESTDASGTVAVNPLFTTDYVIVATGVSGEAHATARVLVRPVIERFVAIADGELRAGDEVELQWIVRGARTLTLSRLGGYRQEVPEAELESGSARMVVGTDGAFTLTARSGSLLAEAHASVSLARAPRIRSLTVDPIETTATAELDATVNVSWFIDGAARITLEAIPGGLVSVGGKSPRGDTVAVVVNEDTTFRLTAINDDGEVQAQTFVGTRPAPVVRAFSALPARATEGELVHLAWETEHAAEVQLFKNGVRLESGTLALNGTIDDQVFTDSVYELVAINGLGYAVTSEAVHVTIGEPAILGFDLTPAELVATGHPLRFEWRTAGGQRLFLTDDAGQEIFETTDLTGIPAGTWTTVGPASGRHTYTLHLVNGQGDVTVTESRTIDATDGPVVLSFATARSLLTVDETLSVSWRTSPDAQGNVPSVRILDDRDPPNVYSLGEANPLDGTAAIQFAQPGVYTLTFEASTPGTTADVETHTVDVRGVPAVVAFTAMPGILDSASGLTTTTLSWTTQHGASLAIHPLDASGNPQAPIHTATGAVATGSFDVAPAPGVHVYRVVVGNGAGRSHHADATVAVDLARVDSFVASTSELVNGEDLTLTWTTTHATDVAVVPLPFSVALPIATVAADPWFDVETALPNAEAPPTRIATWTAGGSNVLDDGFGLVTFPPGFTFPWDGVERTSVRVSTNGFLTFGTATASNITNFELPRAASADIHLAPFWDDLDLRTSGAQRGQVWWGVGRDDRGRFLAIQWKQLNFTGGSVASNDLNFMVLLRPDGSFDYRFGTMAGGPTANGSSATIAFQNPAGTLGRTLRHNTAHPEGLSNKSWRMANPSLAADGNLTLRPSSNVDYRLVARNAYSDASALLGEPVRWYPKVVLSSVSAPAGYALVGADFNLSWSATNAASIDVTNVTLGNAPRCSGVNASPCTIRETAEGTYVYRVTATGQLARDVESRDVTVHVYRPFSLDTFEASEALIDAGTPVVLSWTGTGSGTLALTGNGAAIAIGEQELAGGSFTVWPTESTTYVLTATDTPAHDGPARPAQTLTRSVVVRSAAIGTVTGPSQTFAGQPVTLEWTSTGNDVVIRGGLVEDVTATAPFADIRDEGGVRIEPFSGTAPSAILPIGFAFPWDGSTYTDLLVLGDGQISFDLTATTVAGNTVLPGSTPATRKFALMPFWDDLDARTNGQLWRKAGTDPQRGAYVIVQWTAYGFASSGNPSDLNFQVVLWEDGSFDYRYGTMIGASNYEKAFSATVGYQNESGTLVEQITHNTVMDFANKSWRFRPVYASNDSVTLTPARGGTYEVCARGNGGYEECQAVTIPVIGAGAVMFTELMVAPVDADDGQWVEVRNATGHPIDVNGWQLRSGTDTVTIGDGSPLVLQSGEYLLLASNASALPSDVRVWELDDAIVLGPGAGNLALLAGALVVDQVPWAATETVPAWTVPTGASLSLDPSLVAGIASRNDLRTAWCLSAVLFDGVNAASPGTAGVGCRSSRYDLEPLSDKPFVDILAGPHTLVPGANGGDVVSTIGSIDFPFPFFEAPGYTTARASSNGWLSFDGTTSSGWSNQDIPTSGQPNQLVAVFWDDLKNATGSSVSTAIRTLEGQQVRIVQWTNFQHDAHAGRMTFQVQLWANGDIVTAYRDLLPAFYSGASFFRGGSATFGIEDAGTAASGHLKFSFNEETMWPGRSLHYRRK